MCYVYRPGPSNQIRQSNIPALNGGLSDKTVYVTALMGIDTQHLRVSDTMERFQLGAQFFESYPFGSWSNADFENEDFVPPDTRESLGRCRSVGLPHVCSNEKTIPMDLHVQDRSSIVLLF